MMHCQKKHQIIFYDLQRRASAPVRNRNNTYSNSAAEIPLRFKLNTRWKSAVTSKLPAIYLRRKEQAVSSAVYRKLDGKEAQRVITSLQEDGTCMTRTRLSHIMAYSSTFSWNTLCNVKQN
jgi:uncharacterized iron-regulated membrane protein